MPNLTTEYIIYISSAVLFIILLAIFMVFAKKKKQSNQIPSLELTYLNHLYQALGGSKNIINVLREHQRLQISVNNIKSVDATLLKNLNTPAFIKGKQITLLIKNHTQEVLMFLNEQRKEDY